MHATEQMGHKPTPGYLAPHDAGEPDGIPEEISIYALLTPLSRRWRFVLGLPLGLAILAAVIAVLLPNRYTATTTFSADAAGIGALGNISSLVSLAGQLGVGGLRSEGASPQFFAQVVTSRSVLEQTLLTSFADPDSNETGRSGATLLDLLDVEGDSELERLGRGVKALRTSVLIDVDKQSGIIALSVELSDAVLAANVANRMVELLELFNRDQRQSQSRAQRLFTESRLAQAQSELRTAEAARLTFLERNRLYANSPILAFQEERLARAEQLKQEIFQTLSRTYEEARIAEVQDTPVLTTLDRAAVPYKKSSPRRLLIVLAAFVLGTVLAILVSATSEYLRRVRIEHGDDYSSFERARAEAVSQLRGLLGQRVRG